MKNLRNIKINDSKNKQKQPQRRNKYILENILLNIFKFYISKYIIKFLQSRDNTTKKFGFHNFAEHVQKARGTSVKNQWSREIERERGGLIII